MPTIAETIQEANEILRQNGIAESRREANSLLAFALQKDKTFLIAHPEYELTDSEKTIFNKLSLVVLIVNLFSILQGSKNFTDLILK
ncbi:MAG: hypothetical protein HC846_04120 [Blastocatellia bacterium]|nr:hypothetical protein [Blastocatellia bacterium]